MAKHRLSLDDPRQGELFGAAPGAWAKSTEETMRAAVAEGELDEDLAVRALLNEDLRALPNVTRWEIAGRMSRALGKEVTKWQVDSWTAESKEGHRFPLAYLPAWAWATGSQRLLEHLAAKLGLRVTTDTELERAEVQRKREWLRQEAAALRVQEKRLGGKP